MGAGRSNAMCVLGRQAAAHSSHPLPSAQPCRTCRGRPWSHPCRTPRSPQSRGRAACPGPRSAPACPQTQWAGSRPCRDVTGEVMGSQQLSTACSGTRSTVHSGQALRCLLNRTAPLHEPNTTIFHVLASSPATNKPLRRPACPARPRAPALPARLGIGLGWLPELALAWRAVAVTTKAAAAPVCQWGHAEAGGSDYAGGEARPEPSPHAPAVRPIDRTPPHPTPPVSPLSPLGSNWRLAPQLSVVSAREGPSSKSRRGWSSKPRRSRSRKLPPSRSRNPPPKPAVQGQRRAVSQAGTAPRHDSVAIPSHRHELLPSPI